MNYLPISIEEKKIAMLSIGCMRYPNREETKKIIAECIKNDVLFLDTSPCYCYRSDEENDETWVGEAIKEIREQVIVSAKCSTGNGGDSIGEYDPQHGFSIRTEKQVRMEIEQSLRRLNVSYLDVYSLWAVHTMEIYKEAKKPNGWLAGVLKAKEEGLVKHIGLTGHIGNDGLMEIMDDSEWEIYTVTFFILDSSRKEAIKELVRRKKTVIAMNPLAGGFLTSGSGEKIDTFLKRYGMDSISEMALRYCNAYGASALSGMTDVSQVKPNCDAVSKPILSADIADAMETDFKKLLNHEDFSCTGCGYCMPCPQNINIPKILRNRNHYVVLGIQAAKNELINHDLKQLQACTECRQCENKCPNSVHILDLFTEINHLKAENK